MLLKIGIDGTAKILQIKDTGRSRDFNPVVEVTMEARAPGIKPYRVKKEISLPTQTAKAIKSLKGKELPAKIHPDDRKRMIIEFPL